MYLSEVYIENFRLYGSGEAALRLPLQAGLNVLVGENDSGKTAIIDAIRFALGTTSHDFQRVTDDDLHGEGFGRANKFSIRCKFSDIEKEIGGALLEYLTYEDGNPCLYVNFIATRNENLHTRRRIVVDVRSGNDGNGPILDSHARMLLQTTYLRPLRDAKRELAAGRNSRLSQILQYTQEIIAQKDESFDPKEFVATVEQGGKPEFPKSVTNISLLTDHLINANEGVKNAGKRLDEHYLANLSLGEEPIGGKVSVGGEATSEQRLRSVLEKLELRLSTGEDLSADLPRGLGYNNLLFMACEMLLLGQDDALPLILIEEPEAHLHPQLQLRLIEFLQRQTTQTSERRVQVIVSTHSPNLASKVKLASLNLVARGRCYPLGAEFTMLADTDYKFLERFLDVTKANLFFARGVVIVEGDAENILIPTIARLLGLDLTRYGVSIVNVGNLGLRRYARIFRRRPEREGSSNEPVPIRVACLTDRDILPASAREILGLEEEADSKNNSKRRRRFESEFSASELEEYLNKKRANDGENVETFVSDHWTFEYDLARSGLALELHTAIALARNERNEDRRGDERSNPAGYKATKEQAEKNYQALEAEYSGHPDCDELIACAVYKPLYENRQSKAITAQHLASLLEDKYASSDEDVRNEFRTLVPKYLRDAIPHVTGDKGWDSEEISGRKSGEAD